jgi:hypothetical protein
MQLLSLFDKLLLRPDCSAHLLCSGSHHPYQVYSAMQLLFLSATAGENQQVYFKSKMSFLLLCLD